MLKRSTKFFLKITLSILCLIAFYILAAYSIPFITVNNEFKDTPDGIKVFVISNGLHTDLALLVKTNFKDWTATFPRDSFDVTNPLYTYIAFGWGDKGFYLNTPKWSDLKISTAFKASFGLSESAMHVSYLKEKTNEGDKCVELKIDSSSYKKLISFIETSFEKRKEKYIPIKHPGYGHFDRFFEAKGTYSLFYTCNVWTNCALKETEVKTALWSPFSGGLMRSLRR